MHTAAMNRLRSEAGKRTLAAFLTLSVPVGGLAIAGCGSETHGSEAPPTTASALPLPSSRETTAQDQGAGPYCDTAPADRQKPLGKVAKKLVFAVRSECVGDPQSPVGVYNETEQNHAELAGVVQNGTKFTVGCYYPNGQWVQSNAAVGPDGPWETGSTVWVRGNFPKIGKADLPLANMGFGALENTPQCTEG